jgi:hypothetical protein
MYTLELFFPSGTRATGNYDTLAAARQAARLMSSVTICSWHVFYKDVVVAWS